MYINISEKILLNKNYFSVDLVDKVVDKEVGKQTLGEQTPRLILLAGTNTQWQADVPKDEAYRFNIQLVLKEGKERLEDSELDVLAVGMRSCLFKNFIQFYSISNMSSCFAQYYDMS